MLKYVLHRILIFIPTLIAISLLAFVISINSPADPVEQLARSADSEGSANSEANASERVKNEIRTKLGLDLPVFYCSIHTIADPDTLHLIADKNERAAAKRLLRTYGNWDDISSFRTQIKSLEQIAGNEFSKVSSDSSTSENKRNTIASIRFMTVALTESGKTSEIDQKLEEIIKQCKEIELSSVTDQAELCQLDFSHLKDNSDTWKNYIPWITFNGFDNQYHVWLLGDFLTSKDRGRSGVLRGDFGNSYADNQPIASKIYDKFWYSFRLVIFSILLSYLISIPLGIYSAYRANGLFDRASTGITFMLYSLPSFFVGTWVLYYFANPDNFMWFPTGGVYDPSVFDENWGFFERIRHQAPYFVLPMITYTYSSFAFISRIMKVSMLDVLNQDYIRTARAKGVSEFKVLTKHAFRNALLPLITMFANIFPAAIGGSVILETIFSIPGLGYEVYNAVISTDIPMIVAVFTITGVLTVTGYLFSDILYSIVDPRIRLES